MSEHITQPIMFKKMMKQRGEISFNSKGQRKISNEIDLQVTIAAQASIKRETSPPEITFNEWDGTSKSGFVGNNGFT